MTPGMLVWFRHTHADPEEVDRVMILVEYEPANDWWVAIDAGDQMPDLTSDDIPCVYAHECTPLTPTEVVNRIAAGGPWSRS